MTADDEIEANSPFERVPVCACDNGSGDAPTRLQMLECKLRGGPCSPQYAGGREPAA